MDHDARSARVGEVDLVYELIGVHELVGPPERPVMVMIAGLGRPLVGWDRALCDLLVAEGFVVLRFDNRDSGRSTSFDTVAYTLDDMADDTAGLLDVLGVDAAHVVGTSMGGMIAQTLALRHPTRVRTLCSVMSSTGAPDVGLPSPEAMHVVMRRQPTERSAYVEHELANYRVIGSRGDLVDEGWRRQRYEDIFDWGINPAGVGRQITALVASGDRTDALASLRMPTLVVHGDADTLVAPSGGEATARAVPGARLLVVPGMGHEIPPATWPVVVAGIADNARRAGGSSTTCPVAGAGGRG